MASALKHDAQGFLIGELIDGSRDILRTQEASLQVFRAMRADVKSILHALKVEAGVPSFHAPAGRALSGATRVVGAMPAAQPAAGAIAATVRATARATAVVSPAGRDGRGRFTAKTAGAPGRPNSDTSAAGATSRLTSAVTRLSASLAAPADNLDPTINAVKEVTDVVAPLGRGLFSMFGRGAERKKERWYGRIWSALTDGNKIAKGNKPLSAGGSTSLSIGGGGLLGRAGGALKGAGGLLGGLVKRGGGLLRRIPLLGALLAGGGALASMFGMDDDPTKSAEENRTQRYRGAGESIGMGVGGVLGGVLGSVLGPAGTVAGALVGSLVGEKVGAAVGDWTRDLVDSDIPGKIVAGWNVFTAGVSAAWESLTADIKTAWGAITTKASEWWDITKDAASKLTDKVSELANTANDWIKQKTGVDVRQTASNAWDAGKTWVGDKASQASQFVLDNAGKLVPNTIKRAVAAGAAAATQAKAGYDTARGTENAAPAPAGGLQHGARAAGEAVGGLGNMIARHEGGYGSFNRGVAGDSRGVTMDFSKMTVADVMAAQALPKGDANRLFAVGKYQVIPETMKGAAKAMGLKGDERFTPELQERIFSEYLTDAKRPAIAGYIRGQHEDLAKAQLAGAKEWASIADPRTGKSFYAGSGGNKAGMSAEAFGAGLADARERYKAMIQRGMDEKTAYSAALRAGAPARIAIHSPTVPNGVASNVPASVPPTIPQMPTETVPAATSSSAGAGRGTVGVTIKNEVSQNVPDRGIAHVQTGGLGV